MLIRYSLSPGDPHRRLMLELRKARRETGLRLDQVADAMGWSRAKLARMETGVLSPSMSDLKKLLRYYGIPEDRMSELVEFAGAAWGWERAGVDVTHLGELWHVLSGDDFENAIEAQLAPANLIRPAISATRPDTAETRCDSNEAFWRKIIEEELRANAAVTLEDFFLFEWFPRSPGLFHTKRGHDARVEAKHQHRLLTAEYDLGWPERVPDARRGYYSNQPFDPTVYNLAGKIKMLEGGYGCIRLLPKPTENGLLWFMSASSNQSAHEGVPVAMTEQNYNSCIEYIAEFGAMPCRLLGRLRFLPKPLLSLYQDYVDVPGLYLLVEEILPPHSRVEPPGGSPVVSVAVMFESDTSVRCSAAYMSFVPGINYSMSDGIAWLEDYIGTYGGTIVTDFDEQVRHFGNAVFSLSKVCDGHLKASEIASVVNHYYIDGNTIDQLIVSQQILNKYRTSIRRVNMGDKIEAGAGAVVVNRSSLFNAMNTVERMTDPETANALREIAEFIGQSGNNDAIEIFNEFNNQLQQPAPKKRVLRSLWDGIVSTLPSVATLADATAKIIALIP